MHQAFKEINNVLGEKEFWYWLWEKGMVYVTDE
jgi:hypothetical protein